MTKGLTPQAARSVVQRLKSWNWVKKGVRLVRPWRKATVTGNPSHDDGFPHEQAEALFEDNPFAMVVQAIFDQQDKSWKSLRAPLGLMTRIGHLDPKRIAVMKVSSLAAKIRIGVGPVAGSLHRMPNRMAAFLVGAAELVSSRYAGHADRIWTTPTTVVELQAAWDEVPGIGDGIAAMMTRDCLGRGFSPQVRMSRRHVAPKYDVHVVRVLHRIGLSDAPTRAAAELAVGKHSGDSPGDLDATWWIGFRWCSKRNPDCDGERAGDEGACPVAYKANGQHLCLRRGA